MADQIHKLILMSGYFMTLQNQMQKSTKSKSSQFQMATLAFTYFNILLYLFIIYLGGKRRNLNNSVQSTDIFQSHEPIISMRNVWQRFTIGSVSVYWSYFQNEA